jgi:SAM-dependent methyltransferase
VREDGLIETLMTPVRKVVRRLSAQPQLWNLFRRILEFNFRAEKRVIRNELIPRARRVEKAEDRKPRLLDMGCGTGELAGSFIKAGYSYYGVDIEPERIRYAQRTFPMGKFHVMDASDLVYPDGYFDQILITGVLHHLSDEEVRSIVREIKRVLRPDGRALVMEDIALPLRGSLNFLGALVHLADEGAHIRRPHEYTPLFEPDLALKNSYPVRAGVCDYQAFVLEPATEK